MDSAKLTKLAIGLGALFAIYKFAPNAAVKAMALGAAGVVVGRQLPYVSEVL